MLTNLVVHHRNELHGDASEITDYTRKDLITIATLVAEGICPCDHPEELPEYRWVHLDRGGICTYCHCWWAVEGEIEQGEGTAITVWEE